MDELHTLPKYIDNFYGRAWLTLGTWLDGWQAGYVNSNGLADRLYMAYGKTPEQAVEGLKQNIQFVHTMRQTVNTPGAN